eukprot:s553_g11.t1
MSTSLTEGELVTVEDGAKWTTLAPTVGQIVEVNMCKTNRFVMADSECWAAFFIRSVHNELDGSYVLEVNYMGCEDDTEHAALEALFKGGPQHIHLCLSVPCVVIGHDIDALHATAIRVWSTANFTADYVPARMENMVKLWQKELASAGAPKRRARPGAKAKTEPKKPGAGARAPKASAGKAKTTKGLDDKQKAKLQEKLKRVRKLREDGTKAAASPEPIEDDSEEDGDDGSGTRSSGYSPTPALDTGSTLQPPGQPEKKKKEKDPSAKKGTLALYKGTRGNTTRGLTGQLVQQALAVQDVREKERRRKSKKKDSAKDAINLLRKILTGADGKKEKEKKKKKKRKRKLSDGVIVSSSDSSQSTSQTEKQEVHEVSSDEDLEAPLRKKSRDSPGSVLSLLTEHVREQMQQEAVTEVHGHPPGIGGSILDNGEAYGVVPHGGGHGRILCLDSGVEEAQQAGRKSSRKRFLGMVWKGKRRKTNRVEHMAGRKSKGAQRQGRQHQQGQRQGKEQLAKWFRKGGRRLGEDQGEARWRKVDENVEATLAKAVRGRSSGTGAVSWADILESCPTLRHVGCCLAWLLIQAPDLSTVQGNSTFLDGIYAIGAWPKARRNRHAFPVREGDLQGLRETLEKASLEDVREEAFVQRWNEDAWKYAACFACNALAGHQQPIPQGSWSKPERKLADAVGLSVKRLMSHGQVAHRDFAALEKELRGKRVKYTGEEVGVCHELTMEQVLPSLPPAEHGGSINILHFVSESTKFFLQNPRKMVVEDVGQELPKLQGRLHVQKGCEIELGKELVKRGVCTWTPLDKVMTYRGERVKAEAPYPETSQWLTAGSMEEALQKGRWQSSRVLLSSLLPLSVEAEVKGGSSSRNVVLNDGLQFPKASFGLHLGLEPGQEHLQVYDDETAERLTLQAIEAGYRNFFASVLAGNQKGFARAVQKSGVPRKEFFICGSVLSNLAQDFNDAYSTTKEGCDKNLEALSEGGITELDMILLDYPAKDCETIRGQWKAFEEMKAAKRTKSLAVSNFSPEQLDCILADPAPWNYDAKAVEENGKRGILVQAWGPLGSGSLGISASSACEEIGQKYGKSAAQVALSLGSRNLRDAMELDRAKAPDSSLRKGQTFAQTCLMWSVSLPSGQSVKVQLPGESSVQELKVAAQVALGRKFLTLSKADGTLARWSVSLSVAGLHDGDHLSAVVQLPKMAATETSFAVWRSGGRVLTWGDDRCGGVVPAALEARLRRVLQIEASFAAFAAILVDGTVVTWGLSECGGTCDAVQAQLYDVTAVCACDRSFAAIRRDGRVVTWGYEPNPFESVASKVQERLVDVVQLTASSGAFAATLRSGQVVTWGNATDGADRRSG